MPLANYCLSLGCWLRKEALPSHVRCKFMLLLATELHTMDAPSVHCVFTKHSGEHVIETHVSVEKISVEILTWWRANPSLARQCWVFCHPHRSEVGKTWFPLSSWRGVPCNQSLERVSINTKQSQEPDFWHSVSTSVCGASDLDTQHSRTQ